METDAAIRRLAFAEARLSAREAMIDIARHRTELAIDRATCPQGESARADAYADAARRQVDRTA